MNPHRVYLTALTYKTFKKYFVISVKQSESRSFLRCMCALLNNAGRVWSLCVCVCVVDHSRQTPSLPPAVWSFLLLAKGGLVWMRGLTTSRWEMPSAPHRYEHSASSTGASPRAYQHIQPSTVCRLAATLQLPGLLTRACLHLSELLTRAQSQACEHAYVRVNVIGVGLYWLTVSGTQWMLHLLIPWETTVRVAADTDVHAELAAARGVTIPSPQRASQCVCTDNECTPCCMQRKHRPPSCEQVANVS